MSTRELELDIRLSVLDDLGLRLYSSTPAVLSEIVANAWDADADLVEITLNPDDQTIVITDNGEGMTFEEAQSRFLTVGYRRRDLRPVRTDKYDRPVMGRKGIGKLAPLAIADNVIVETRKDGQFVSFELDVNRIRQDIKDNVRHKPRIIGEGITSSPNGTTLRISKPRRQLQWAEAALKKRLARRFAIIGPSYSFQVLVNDIPVSPDDVDYYGRVQFAWNYNLAESDSTHQKLSKPPRWETRLHEYLDDSTGTSYRFTGWIGTVEKTTDLEDNRQKFGGIAVFSRGKLSHEDATTLVGDDHLFTKYLVGEVQADFLDEDGAEDIATSNRQGLLEDDPRVDVLRKFLVQELKYIGSKWTEYRQKLGEEKVEENPGVKQYLNSLQPDPRKLAKRLLGKIWAAKDDVSDRAELIRAGILLCENLRVTESLHRIEQMDVADVESLRSAFELVDVLQATQYRQLIEARHNVIEVFKKITNDNEKEKVLQEHIAKHLWLLNPGWDVVPTRGALEVEVNLKDLALKLKGTGSTEEKLRRLDIFYSATSTTHVIIELKRYAARPSIGELIDQVKLYRQETQKILDSSGRGSESIEIYILLGQHTEGTPAQRLEGEQMLGVLKGRIVLYDELINRAQKLHEGYLNITSDSIRLTTILASV